MTANYRSINSMQPMRSRVMGEGVSFSLGVDGREDEEVIFFQVVFTLLSLCTGVVWDKR